MKVVVFTVVLIVSVLHTFAQINIKELGAKGDGKTNDTEYFYSAFSIIEERSKGKNSPKTTLLVPKGEYLVNPLEFPSHIKLVFEAGSSIRAGAGFEYADCLFVLNEVENVEIIGNNIRISMPKDEYMGGEWRHGVSITGSKKVLIHGVVVDKTGGDGFYIAGSKKKAYSENIKIIQCKSLNAKRNGLSIISVKNLVVEDSEFSYSSGTAPELGIDIEPNGVSDVLLGVKIRNVTTKNNNNAGIAIQPFNLVNYHNLDARIDIQIDKWTSSYDGLKKNVNLIFYFPDDDRKQQARIKGRLIIKNSNIFKLKSVNEALQQVRWPKYSIKPKLTNIKEFD